MNSFKNKLMRYGIMTMIGVTPLISYGADLPKYTAGSGPVQSVSDVVGIITTITAAVFWILMALSILMVVYAAFLYVTAAGDSEKVGKANQTLVYAVIGIAVALLASGVPFLVKSIIGSGSASAGGSSIAGGGITPDNCADDGSCGGQ